jgi:hypothetical protein
MDEPVKNPDRDELLRMARTLRFALVALISGISYPNIRLALDIPAFQRIFHDMLGGKPLPTVTTFVIQAHPILVPLSFALPCLAILTVFFRRWKYADYLVASIIIVVFVQLFFTWHAVALPLTDIIQGMEVDTH